MQSLEEIIEILRTKDANRQAKYAELRESQMREYNSLNSKIVSLKDERNSLNDNVVKNLRKLTNQQHAVHKLLQDSSNHLENVVGLPVSQNFHAEAFSLLTDAISFVNNFKQTQKILASASDKDLTPAQLVEKLTLCADAIGNEICNTKSQILQIKTLKDNIDVLQN